MESGIETSEEFKGITFVLCCICAIAIFWVLAGISLMVFVTSHWLVSFMLFWWIILTVWMIFRIFDTWDWFYRKLFHWKMFWVGHTELDKNGQAMIPCKRCGHRFLSYEHYAGDGGYCYDSLCETCEEQV